VPNWNPLTDTPPKEVPLPNAPLVRVIAQARFPVIAAVEQKSFVAPFQEQIRNDYPVLRPDETKNVVVGLEGVINTTSSVIWRFEDLDGLWRISLGSNFLAIETKNYKSRDDFVTRFEATLRSAGETIEPSVVDRLGIRYIDRIGENEVNRLPELIRPEVASVMNTVLKDRTVRSITESVFEIDQGYLSARWGLVPPNATTDPTAMEPTRDKSWILDVDAYTEQRITFKPHEIARRTKLLAERAYCFFRWSVKDPFLENYGGQPHE